MVNLAEKPIDAERLAKVEDALHELLTAIVSHDYQRPDQPKPALRVMSFAEICAAPILSRSQEELERIIDDPVARALRYAVRRLGEELYRVVGSTQAIVDVAERIAYRDEKLRVVRLHILDKWFSGIGAGDDVWTP